MRPPGRASAAATLAMLLPTLDESTREVLKHRFGIRRPERTREQTAELMAMGVIAVVALEKAGIRELRRRMGVQS